jgi:hypothetical protein
MPEFGIHDASEGQSVRDQPSPPGAAREAASAGDLIFETKPGLAADELSSGRGASCSVALGATSG